MLKIIFLLFLILPAVAFAQSREGSYRANIPDPYSEYKSVIIDFEIKADCSVVGKLKINDAETTFSGKFDGKKTFEAYIANSENYSYGVKGEFGKRNKIWIIQKERTGSVLNGGFAENSMEGNFVKVASPLAKPETSRPAPAKAETRAKRDGFYRADFTASDEAQRTEADFEIKRNYVAGVLRICGEKIKFKSVVQNDSFSVKTFHGQSELDISVKFAESPANQASLFSVTRTDCPQIAAYAFRKGAVNEISPPVGYVSDIPQGLFIERDSGRFSREFKFDGKVTIAQENGETLYKTELSERNAQGDSRVLRFAFAKTLKQRGFSLLKDYKIEYVEMTDGKETTAKKFAVETKPFVTPTLQIIDENESEVVFWLDGWTLKNETTGETANLYGVAVVSKS